MEKTYQPEHIEKHWYQIWEEGGYFQPSCEGPSYCIMLPPPNVTGTLHMGHGFQISLMDALTRYHRMKGYKTLWQVGTDHAGIATQMVVELQLQSQGTSRQKIGRETFIERVWQWKEASDGTIKFQLRRLGASVDWTRERFSLDEGLSKAVNHVFVNLYDENLIYRGKRLVNWDPVLLTAISDLEVVSKEEEGQLWFIRYPLVEENNFVVIATTRPETLLGDTAVAVNPLDERYQPLIGKQIKLPLTDRIIPIIADESVDQTFGTGCVKITPAHDFNDYATATRHNLPMINILTPEGRLNTEVPSPYQGLDRFTAREKIVTDLTDLGLIEKVIPHVLNVPKGERSGAIIEPYMSDQWYVRTKPLSEPAIEVVKQHLIKFIPDTWTKIYFQWLEGIQDWCISRQLWWGHRIPAWYDEAGNIYVAGSELEVREKYQLPSDLNLKQDEDVLDTWFSAALWPFATLGWPTLTDDFNSFYPTDVLVTGFDIIFFWVSRMIMMGLKFTNQVPFREVYVTGLIRDSEGQKMSKSKGNIIDPIDLIDGIPLDDLIAKRTKNLLHPSDTKRITELTRKEFPNGIPPYGTDALRFTFYALATPGRDIKFDLGRIEGYRNFCNKLWNAARFVFMNTEKEKIFIPAKDQLNVVDRWIQSRLQRTIAQVHQAFKNYRFDILAHTIYEFIWNEYCDWYLELTKIILNSTEYSEKQKSATRYNLLMILESMLRLAHPFMPFITEEIWQRVAPILDIECATIMLQPYPECDETQIDQQAETDINWLKEVIVAIRNIRGEMNITPGKTIPLLLNKGTDYHKESFTKYHSFVTKIAKIASIDWLHDAALPPSATAIIEELEIHIPMADLIDKNAEMKRLSKEILKLDKEIDRSNSKLKNQDYISKAPSNVVENEKNRLDELENLVGKLRKQLHLIKEI